MKDDAVAGDDDGFLCAEPVAGIFLVVGGDAGVFTNEDEVAFVIDGFELTGFTVKHFRLYPLDNFFAEQALWTEH